jgi:transposase
MMATKTTTRRTFTDEFKREAVVLLASSGRPLTQVAAELGIQPSMLRSWRGAVNGGAKPMASAAGCFAAAAPSAEQAEIRRLQRELERTQMERDILKKAVGIFSGPPR